MAKKHTAEDINKKRLLIVQVDGLSFPLLEGEIKSGKMQTLAKWLNDKTHRFVEWETDLPSMTSSSQAGIMYGSHHNIPAFRWYDKKLKRLFVSNHPKDAYEIDKLLQVENEGLLKSGSSINNLFSGQAEHSVMTMSQMVDTQGERKIKNEDFNDYLGNPYNLSRSIILMVWEILVEYKEALVARNHRVKMHRGGVYPLLRAAVCVLLRDVTTFLAVAEIYRGRPIIYLDYLGYDEVSHHSGVKSKDAKRVLWKLDRTFAVLEKAVESANLNYEILLLSDHGQSWGSTFKQRFGESLYELISQLTSINVSIVGSSDESKSQVDALFTETSKQKGVVGKVSDKLKTKEKGNIEVSGNEVVVCASGNLAQVYLPGEKHLNYSEINKQYPNLIPNLIAHPGIGFVMVATDKGPWVLGKNVSMYLKSKKIKGQNPLNNFPQSTAKSLLNMSDYSNLGDIMVNSFYNPETGEVCAFEELIGCHGGAGGWQTRPFLIYPSSWSKEEPRLFGADQIYHFIKNHN
jgi:hypothetical protein